MINNEMSRRSVLYALSMAPAANRAATARERSDSGRQLKVAIFSKHLLFLHGNDLPEAAAKIGFDGIDLAVRKGGHVAPERVKQDLPGVVAAIREHHLEVPMLTTDIADVDTPYCEDILRAMSELGIKHYRWGGFKYTDSQPMAAQIEAFKPRVEKLAALNARYGVGAMYHTHSGINLVGAPIWDLHEILRGMDPKAVGVNYDIGHATVEGGFGGWIDSLRISGDYVRGIAVKDFLWKKNARGRWVSAWTPLGEGMVRLPEFFGMIAAMRFSGPVQLHFEYPLGGAEEGNGDIANRDEVYAAMSRDLKQLRGYLSEARL
jgi:sugar phosphate isomerase/epimerase